MERLLYHSMLNLAVANKLIRKLLSEKRKVGFDSSQVLSEKKARIVRLVHLRFVYY